MSLVGVRDIIGTTRENSSICIGNKLFTRTGFHIMVDNGICEIGDNCFFNHNCSITCLERVSMGDANYFSRMFRKVEGSSPSEYRKQW